MTGITLGSTPITGIYLGSTPITGVYLGSTKLWPVVSRITYTLNLPAPTVGVAYTGSIVATNVDGAAGAITFTGTLPAGMTFGTVTVSGDTYTQPIGGTPTTAGTVNPAFAITNGTQTENPAYEFVVVSNGLTFVGASPYGLTGSTSNFTNTTSIAVQAGDVIIFSIWSWYGQADVPTDNVGTTYSEVPGIPISKRSRFFYGVAQSAGTLTVNARTTGGSDYISSCAWVVRGGDVTLDYTNLQVLDDSNIGYTRSYAATPAISAAGIICLAAGYAASDLSTITSNTPYISDGSATNVNNTKVVYGHMLESAAASESATIATASPDWVQAVIAPFKIN